MTEAQDDAPAGVEQRKLRPNVIGTAALAFTVIATVGPMAAFMGAAPLVFMTSGAGASGTYALATVLMLLFAVGYLAMTRKMGNASGFILFIGHGLGRSAGLSAAIVTLVTYAVFIAGLYGVYTVFVQQALADFVGVSLPWGLVAVVLILINTVLSYNRVEFSIRIMGILLVLAVAAILVLDIAVLVQGGAGGGFSLEGFLPQSIFGAGFGLAALFALASFGGVESTAVFSEEAREPHKTVPRAMYIVILVLGAFYVFSTWVVANAVGVDEILQLANENPTGFIFDIAAEYVGPLWVQVLNVLVVTSFFAVLLGFTNMATRYVFALGRAGLLPSSLGRSHKKHQSPHIASIWTGVVVLIVVGGFIIAGADPFGQLYVWLLAIGTVGVLGLMCASSLAVVFSFRRDRDSSAGLWGGTIAPIISFLGFAAAIIAAIANFGFMAGGSGFIEWLWVVILVAAIVGLVLGSLPRFRAVRFDQID